MAPPRPVLAQSESKQRFFQRLDLDEQNEYHRRLYAMMKEEAVEGRKRMTDDPNALLPELRGDTSIQPPYSHAHVSETAVHREILNIYRLARPETRGIYDLGRDTERIEEENWVIRWMLWHVFRYRDNRNKSRRQLSTSGSPGDGNDSNGGGGSTPVAGPSGTGGTTGDQSAAPATNTGPSRYWDPVRGA